MAVLSRELPTLADIILHTPLAVISQAHFVALSKRLSGDVGFGTAHTSPASELS